MHMSYYQGFKFKKTGGTIKELWLRTFIMPRMQTKPIACLALIIQDFKREDVLGGHIINKKSNICLLKKEFDVINVQQNQQHQQ